MMVRQLSGGGTDMAWGASDGPASSLIAVQARVFEAIAGDGALVGTLGDLTRRFGTRSDDLLACLDELRRAGWVRAETDPGGALHLRLKP